MDSGRRGLYQSIIGDIRTWGWFIRSSILCATPRIPYDGDESTDSPSDTDDVAVAGVDQIDARPGMCVLDTGEQATSYNIGSSEYEARMDNLRLGETIFIGKYAFGVQSIAYATPLVQNNQIVFMASACTAENYRHGKYEGLSMVYIDIEPSEAIRLITKCQRVVNTQRART